MTRKQASLLVQLCTGHIPLNQHLACIGATHSPLCPACRVKEESVLHYLLTCPAYALPRAALEAKLGRDSRTLAKLLSHPKAVGPLLRHISATRRLSTSFGEVLVDS